MVEGRRTSNNTLRNRISISSVNIVTQTCGTSLEFELLFVYFLSVTRALQILREVDTRFHSFGFGLGRVHR